jgi:hypothetical protein
MTDRAHPAQRAVPRALRRAYAVVYVAVALVFALCAVALVVYALIELWGGIRLGSDVPLHERFAKTLEAIGLLTISVAALELSQTVIEEEVLREASMSAPTRVRRFLSRFLVVVVVALAIESLVAAFEIVHQDPAKIPHCASLAVGAAALLAAWGLFVRLNTSAEKLEPEAMERAKDEDEKVDTT